MMEKFKPIDQAHLIWKQLGAKFDSIVMKVKDLPDSLKEKRDWNLRRIGDYDQDEEVVLYKINNYA